MNSKKALLSIGALLVCTAQTPEMNRVGFYALRIQGVAVGTLHAFGEEGLPPKQIQMTLVHRFGLSPMTTSAVLRAEKGFEGKSYTGVVDTAWNGTMGVLQTSAALCPLGCGDFLEEALFLNGSGTPSAKDQQNAAATENRRLAIWNPDADAAALFPSSVPPQDIVWWSPMGGGFLGERQSGSLKWDADGFLKEGRFELSPGLEVELQRTKVAESAKILDEAALHAVDFRYISAPGAVLKDVKNLQQIASRCSESSAAMEATIATHLPQIPYLTQRRIANLRLLCDEIMKIPVQSEAKVVESLWNTMANVIQGEKKEFPGIFGTDFLPTHPGGLAPLVLPRILTSLIPFSQMELESHFFIDEQRKVSVTLRPALKLLPRAVVKAILVRESGVPVVNLETSAQPDILSESLRSTPTEGSQMASAKNRLNGISWLRGVFQNMGSICTKGGQSVSLDLGDSHNEVVRFGGNVAVWDKATRTVLMRDFLRKSAMQESCQTVTLRVPKDMEGIAQAEIQTFVREILQTEQEFQLSNGIPKSVILLPGKYRLTVVSLVNGQKLGEQMIEVIPGKHATVPVTGVL